MADIIGVMYILLDTARASDFATDNSQMLNLADTFVSSLQNDLQALQNALSESDANALKSLLHTLKGYVTFLCNESLANQLIDIEAKAREMTAEQLQPMVNALLPALVNMHREVTDWREHLSKGS
jgi:HPt (histidine-containing phosphotransfer) domain-containing protein